MDSSTNRDHFTTDQFNRLQPYLNRVLKASLCVAGWGGIFAVLLTYGPPAMSISSGATAPASIVTGMFAVLLSGGAATLLTIILGVFGLAAVGWNRNQSTDSHDDTDTMEDESHV